MGIMLLYILFFFKNTSRASFVINSNFGQIKVSTWWWYYKKRLRGNLNYYSSSFEESLCTLKYWNTVHIHIQWNISNEILTLPGFSVCWPDLGEAECYFSRASIRGSWPCFRAFFISCFLPPSIPSAPRSVDRYLYSLALRTNPLAHPWNTAFT